MRHDALQTVWPQKIGEIDSPNMDSAAWNLFPFRDDDIVVATYAKSGTTLTQQICLQLITGGDPDIFGGGAEASPWIDFRVTPDARLVAEEQTLRRVLKTHLPIENLVFSPKARYLVVARDPRDVAWSWHNHIANITPEFLAAQPGMTLDVPDLHIFYHAFLDGPGQPEPYWPHIQGWWDARHLPNVLLLHYAEFLADLPGSIRCIAAFLDIEIDEQAFPTIVAHCRPDHMRQVGATDPLTNFVFKEGSSTFINKATNGRWRNVLTAAESDKAEKIAARKLSADCAAWLMRGGDAEIHCADRHPDSEAQRL
jgi:aryl sulfotransferase